MTTQPEIITPNTPVNGLGRSALAGLLTGGPVGLLLSPLTLYAIHKSGRRGTNKWTTWAACGVVGVPLSWLLTAIPFAGQHSIDTQSTASTPTTATSTTPKTSVPAAPIATLQVGDFTYSNVSFAPYEYNGSADVAGKLIAVYADVANTGNKSDAPTLQYTVKDEKGREFKMAAFGIGVMDGGATITNGVLPGQTRHVRVGIFDVSPDSQTYELGVSQLFGNPSYVQGAQQ